MRLPPRAIPVLFVLMWSTGFIAARWSTPHAGPLSFLTVRFIVAGLLMALIAGPQALARLTPIQKRDAMVTGALMHGLYLGAIFWTIARGMPAGVSALIVGLQPLLTALLNAAVTGERISHRHWLGLAVGLAGVGLVVSPKLSHGLTGITPVTVGLTIAGTLAIASGTIWQKRRLGPVDLRAGVVFQYAGAAIVTGLGVALLEPFHFDMTGGAFFALSWSVLVLSIGAISLLMLLIRQGDVARVAGLIYLVPACTALMAFILFGETLTLIQIIGMGVCAAGVMLVTRAP